MLWRGPGKNRRGGLGPGKERSVSRKLSRTKKLNWLNAAQCHVQGWREISDTDERFKTLTINTQIHRLLALRAVLASCDHASNGLFCRWF